MRITSRLRRIAASTAVLAVVLAGCSTTQQASDGTDTSGTSTTSTAVAASTGTTVAEAVSANKSDHDDAEDHEWDESQEVTIELDGDTATTDSSAVTIEDGTVTITEAGTYRLSGTLTEGQVVVDTADEGVVRLVLDGADITSSTTAAIAVLNADETVVELAKGSENTLTDASEYADVSTDAPNAALFSADDLTISGTGSLRVQGNSNDGIASKDGLVITAGDVTVDAVDDGIRGKDYVVVSGGTVAVTAGGDGLKSDTEDDETAGYVLVSGGSVAVTSGADGIQAQTDVLVSGGSVQVESGGGSSATLGEDDSAKGLKGGVSVVVDGGTVEVDAADEGMQAPAITIDGGEIDVSASDDGINASDGSGSEGGGSEASDDVMLTISGGSTVIDADGDGFDSNGSASMTGGTLVVNGPTESMNGAVDVNGSFEITGGTLVAVGSSGMAEAPDEGSEQGWLAATFDTEQTAGSVVQVTSADGEVVAEFEAGKSFSSVVYSSSEITQGDEYDVVVDGSTGASTTVTAGENAGGMSGQMGGDLSGAGGDGTPPDGERPDGTPDVAAPS